MCVYISWPLEREKGGAGPVSFSILHSHQRRIMAVVLTVTDVSSIPEVGGVEYKTQG